MLVLYMVTKLMNAQVPIYSCGMCTNKIKQYHMRYIFQCMLHFYFLFVIVIIYSMYLYIAYEIKDDDDE